MVDKITEAALAAEIVDQLWNPLIADQYPTWHSGNFDPASKADADHDHDVLNATNVYVKDVLLEESAGRAGLLRITAAGTGWQGIQVGPSTLWSLMATGSTFALYDDTNMKYALSAKANGSTILNYAGSQKLTTTSSGVTVTGTLSTSIISASTVSATNLSGLASAASKVVVGNNQCTFKYGAVALGSNSHTTIALGGTIVTAVTGVAFTSDEEDGSSCAWSGSTLTVRNSAGASRTIRYWAWVY